MTTKNKLLHILFFGLFSINLNLNGAANTNKLTEKSKQKVQTVCIIDRDKLITESDYMLGCREALKDMEKELYDSIAPMYQELQDKQAKIEKQGKTMSPEALEKENRALSELFQEFQMKTQAGQEHLKRTEVNYIQGFSSRLSEATADYLKQPENSDLLIVPSDSSIYVHEKYNITNEVMSLMNTNYAAEKSTNTKKENKENKENKDSKSVSKEKKQESNSESNTSSKETAKKKTSSSNKSSNKHVSLD